MKKGTKRLVSLLTLFVLLLGVIYVPQQAQAANEFYGDYTDAAKIYDYGSCPSMQGLAVGSQQLYTVKIGSNDSLAFISMTNKDTGSTTKLYNADAGSYYFNYLGHANDMDVWSIDGYSNLFVTTTNEGSNAIVRLKRSGNNLYKVASYSLTYNGSPTCATALAIKSVSGGVITFITKLGMNLYTGTVSTGATSANIELKKLCTISKARVYIKGQYLDLSDFVNQGFGYYQNTLFVPISGDDSQLNRSVIMVYDLSNASGTIYPTEALVFRVTSGAYSALFEIESCDISSGDGKLYFNTNRRKTNSDTNHDGVSSVDGYTFEKLPVDAPTSAPKYTMRYNANGGTGTMADTVVTYGQATKLRANSFVRSGYTFKGWTAHRTAQDQWYYTNGSSSGWYKQGSQPEGYSYYIYKDQVGVSATSAVPDDVVQLYAQWEAVPVVEPEVTEPEVTEPEVTEPEVTEPEVTEPEVTEPEVTEPEVTEPGVTTVQEGKLVKVNSLKTGVPYVLTERVSGHALTGTMTYKTDADYKGLNGTQGLKIVSDIDVDNAPVWYYTGTYLRYGSTSGQYLIYNNSNQVALGSLSDGKPFDKVTVYSSSDKSFNLYPSGKTSGSTNYYINQLGGSNYNAAGLYSSAYYSRWQFSELLARRSVTLRVTPLTADLTAGQTLALNTSVLVNNTKTSDYTISYTSSDPAIASVSSAGVVTGVSGGEVKITAKVTDVDGRALDEAMTITVTLNVTDVCTVSGKQSASLQAVNSLKTGVPYVLTERASGHALTGTMGYKTDSDYKGLNGTQGLKMISSINLSNAPVWYYTGTYLRYGSTSGQYLIYNNSNQVALGSLSDGKPFDKVTVYSSSDKTFNLYPSGKTSGSTNYYINQLGGANYNIAGLYSSAYYSRWQFSQVLPERSLSVTAPGSMTQVAGETATPAITVMVDGKAATDYTMTYSSTNDTIASVDGKGTITANGVGNATITLTLTSANGRTLEQPISMTIALRCVEGAGYTASAVQAGSLTRVSSLKTGVPYLITESVSGDALSGDMMYISDVDYKGLNGIEGLEITSEINLRNAPVWYYDGNGLRYGSTSGQYLTYSSAGQVVLGSGSLFDQIKLYSSGDQTFNIYPNGTTKYLNQLGGTAYNTAGVYGYTSTSRWHFSEVVPERLVTLKVTPTVKQLGTGKTATLTAAVTVNGAAGSDAVISWSTSDASVATVSGGTLKAVSSGTVTITATLTSVDGLALQNPVTVEIPLTVA